MIEVEGLNKRFEEVQAVDNLSLRVKSSEILGLVGVNGAGKTTCLRMLAGILPPTSGSIFIGGEPMTGESVAARRRLAFVPDTPMLFDSLTTLEHLLFTARLYGVEEPHGRIDALLDEFDLEERRHATASALSRGMRQKLAICCAFVHDPEVMLLDEPLTGLDPPGRRRMCDSIARRAQAGSAVIVSSHQLEIVERLSTRFFLVHQGREMASGTMADIRALVGHEAEEANLEDLFMRAIGIDEAGAAGTSLAKPASDAPQQDLGPGPS